jgi:hypothetical protein
MRMRLFAVSLVLVASGARAGWDCDHTAPRRVSAPLTGVSHIKVIGRAGTLRVAGRPGVREVVATGTACSSEKNFLNEIQLRAEQSGSVLRIEAVIPERNSIFGWGGAKLDFEVTVPDSIAIDVHDGSGDLEIENVGPLRVVDGSGELRIRGVNGNLDVQDGSGELTIAGVHGDVKVEDGSGGMTITRVDRNVTIVDGSGSIEASDIHGDFTVEEDGSGGIDYERVGGKVTIPRR